jgi:hypothetical protein
VAGDADGDGDVDYDDYIVWVNHYNQATGNGVSDADFNINGIVDGIDYSIWQSNYSP